MKRLLVVWLCLSAGVAVAQPTPGPAGLTAVNHGATLTGNGQKPVPLDVRTAVGGGLQGGGAVPLGLLSTCGANQVLQWSGSAWACAANGGGAVAGTLNRLAKYTPDGTHVGSSSILDDGTNVTMTEPILRTLGSSRSQILSLNSTLVPGAGTWGLWQSEVYEPDPVPYYDKTIQLGYNFDGVSRPNTAEGAAWMQGESKFDDDGAGPHGYQTEWHFSTQGNFNGATERRWISHEAKWDGTEASTTFAANTTSWLDRDLSANPLMRLYQGTIAASAVLALYGTENIATDNTDLLTVKTNTGNVDLFHNRAR